MNTIDTIWLILYSTILCSIIIVHHLLINYIRNKSPGSKSIHDVAFQDTLYSTRFSGLVISLIAILSRFEGARIVFTDYPMTVTYPCALYVFAFVTVCVNAGCFCIVRILCIINFTFMEETISETSVRLISSLVTISSGVTACMLLGYNDDINSGTAMTMLTHKLVPTGT